jgi:hypothetical protein
METHSEEAFEGPLVAAEARALSTSPPEPATQTAVDVGVHLIEFPVGVPGPEVVAPPSQHRIEAGNHPLGAAGLPTSLDPATGRSGAYPGGTLTRWFNAARELT